MIWAPARSNSSLGALLPSPPDAYTFLVDRTELRGIDGYATMPSFLTKRGRVN